jgi:hypothetical protein
MTGRHTFPAPTPSDWLSGTIPNPDERFVRAPRRHDERKQEPRYV